MRNKAVYGGTFNKRMFRKQNIKTLGFISDTTTAAANADTDADADADGVATTTAVNVEGETSDDVAFVKAVEELTSTTTAAPERKG